MGLREVFLRGGPLICLGFDGIGGFTIQFNEKIDFLRLRVDFLRGGNDPPAPAKLLDLNADQFEISHSPLHFLLLRASAGTMYDEAPVVPAGPLVVPPMTLLLLASVKRTVVVVIAVPEVVLALLVAETAAGLIPSKVTPAVLIVQEVSTVILLTRGSAPVVTKARGE